MTNRKKEKSEGFRFTIANIVFIVMLVLLSVSVIAEIFVPNYKTNPLLYTAFGAVAGLVLKDI